MSYLITTLHTALFHLNSLLSIINNVTLYIGSSTGNRVMSCDKVCSKCPIVICDKEFITNFLLIDNCDFDIILGMNWPSWVHAVINYQKKSVVF